ncbi:Cyclopropane-fatty-acyl-phospholipid synthase [Plesiomonas shigelloides]|uniref:Cyclopropane fatty acyl phospholipid synthase n=1 Tax=Plesiomonas shigelloides TaxID=703 RepID=A0A1A9AXP3_PLESH|nr:cyclopropane fatty acyl phospholipid synthase [Plesiomonas shigelloides]AVQ86354.1 cyclopropane fatty acyl phospholipid synthase [Plesiomonas shigelloides]KAB7674260.1 cyclopropane fatty acyl phospholipid synthase [Plesiomonas shigelloides]KAB7674711.1 cyclopropane fatty acyl phospholipid synthase [Plesiomonas shigelloides]KAB7688129.1 cyclopropane fatty acyl phospholipid synthase [Plesiomonas shigelloides]KAB7695121.1 cyclopropane fatty acyl phospholipid synthase [Plesiomonas shigelloides]
MKAQNTECLTSTDDLECAEIKPDNWTRIATELLDKAGIMINGPRPFDMRIKHPDTLMRILQEGSLGLGESYMDGWWECDRLDVFFDKVLTAKLDQQLPSHLKDILRIARARLFNMQTRHRAWQVGKEHYDLGNDLFNAMLDPNMQYSCAYWKDADTLADAQVAKLKMICEKLQLKPGMKVLDIGCGWGGLAAYMAKEYGVSVVGVTISKEQQQLAQKRCEGLPVQIMLQDYRDLNEEFDRIVSVGMFEHVGPKNYRTYFNVVNRCLKKDGLFLLHCIGSNTSGVKADAWISKYIFPNGCLPSIRQIADEAEGHLIMEDWHNFGADYDKTLMAWDENFVRAWDSIKDNYSPRFYRMFRYYLNACAGAFRARDIQLWQVLFSHSGLRGGVYITH